MSTFKIFNEYSSTFILDCHVFKAYELSDQKSLLQNYFTINVLSSFSSLVMMSYTYITYVSMYLC